MRLLYTRGREKYMGKKATKAADNVFCIARYEAAKKDAKFSSREGTAEEIGIDRTRLAKIELGTIVPYPEEVMMLSKAYNMPELCNQYCCKHCPIGQDTVTELNIEEFDRLALKVLSSLNDTERLRNTLIAIADDGKVSDYEYKDFKGVLNALDKISTSAMALKLWASKYIQDLYNDKEDEE